MVGEQKRYYSSIYFNSVDEEQKNANLKNKFFHIDELTKYVYPVVGTSSENKAKRLAWARNYGFFLIAKKHICVNSTNLRSYPNLCRNSSSFQSWKHIDNITPLSTRDYNSVVESIWAGPTQLLFY